MKNDKVKILVQLLDEGSFTARPTTAISLGDGRYRILATPRYDPDDERWEFPPNTIVRGINRRFQDGENLYAVDDADPVPIIVLLKGEGPERALEFQAVPIGEDLYKIWEPDRFDPIQRRLEFQPGSIVRLDRRTIGGRERLVAVGKSGGPKQSKA